MRTSSFLTLSIRDTLIKLLKNFIARTFTLLLSAVFIPHASDPCDTVGAITPSYDTSLHPLLLSTPFSTFQQALVQWPAPIYTMHKALRGCCP